jgi:aspartyl-tRNA(Asn)/glutamyl-tRNA(Gln) amidotransferase subunit C
MSTTPTITPKEVERIAFLARLGLSSREVKQTTQDLSNILGHFATIQDIDTRDVRAAEDVSGLRNVTREDKPQPSALSNTEDLFARVPHLHKNQIKVQAVFDGE